jgi:hypothetical protein
VFDLRSITYGGIRAAAAIAKNTALCLQKDWRGGAFLIHVVTYNHEPSDEEDSFGSRI